MARIAMLPGDGIGPEVVAATRRVLQHLDRSEGLDLDCEHFELGAEHYLATGETLSQATFEHLRDDFDAIFVGAFGDPRVPSNIHARDILLGLRFRLDLYVNLRPVRLLVDGLGPLKGKRAEDVDFVIFRENTEGLYTNHGRREQPDTEDELAVSEMRCTYRGTERIVRAAFEHARMHGLRSVCMADKSNAVEHTGKVWQRVFLEVAADYPDVEARHLYIDALCMEMVRAPEQFDVIVTGNLFGDIVSDLGAQLQGGMGLAASANLNPGHHALFEPVHGTAPAIAGQGIANPLGAILSAALMLDYLGHARVAHRLEEAVASTLREGPLPPDLGGQASTAAVANAVVQRL